jgi:hypothetical protein
MSKSKAFWVVLSVLFLSACGSGGGGDGGNTSTTTATGTSYTAAAAIGELLTYTLDTTNLTYSYTITESQYGLTGKTGSGTLTANGDGTYTPSGAPNARVAVLPNGLLIGGIRETINGVSRTIPIIGLSNPVTTMASLEATYNSVAVECLAGSCGTGYGTFRLNANGTWVSCVASDYDADPLNCSGHQAGTLNSLGGGKWQVWHNGTDIGTALVFASGAQKVVIVDLKDSRAGGFGYGLLVGSTKIAVANADANGTWRFNSVDGTSGAIVVSNGTYTHSADNYQTMYTLTLNSPWDGLVAPQPGGHAILAGTGVYVYENTGYFSVGLKR